MSHSRLRRLGFERLENRLVYSAAVADLPHALAVAAVADPPVSQVAGSGQFEGRKTINYISGSIGANQPAALSTVYVLRDQEFHFVLTAAEWGRSSAGGVVMSIRDAAGDPIFSMLAAAGISQADEAYLDAGAYTVEFTRDAPAAGGVLGFQLGGVTLPLADTTQDPAEESSNSTLAEYSFYWLPPRSVSPAIVVQEPHAILASTSSQNGSPATVPYLLTSTPPETVELPPPQASSAVATPPAAGTPATGIPSSAAIPAEPESTTAPALLGIPAWAPSHTDDYSAAAGGMTAAAQFPPRLPGRPSASALGDDLRGDLTMARAAAATKQTDVEPAPAQPLDESSVATPSRESVVAAESAGLVWHWLTIVNEHLGGSWRLAPVIVALGWCAWQARASRKHPGDAESEFPSVGFAAHPLRSLTQ